MRFAVAVFILLVSGLASAAELQGVQMPEQIAVAGKQLFLNGLGLRLATMFHVNVYVGALYLEKKSSSASEILASPEQKRVVLTFLRDVGAGKIQDAWSEGLEKNCSSGCDAFKKPIEELKKMTSDMKKGDSMIFDFFPEKVEVTIRGQKLGAIQDSKFPAQLLKDWIGNPPNDELKNGMLGKK